MKYPPEVPGLEGTTTQFDRIEIWLSLIYHLLEEIRDKE